MRRARDRRAQEDRGGAAARALDAEERERRRIEEAQRLERERAAEEISLYKKGAEARVRGSRRGLDADKFEAEELWRRLMKLRLERHGETDFTAVAISNVAVLMSEYAGDSDIKRADARLLSGRAIDVMRKHVAREIAADRAAQAGANEQYEADMAAWREEMVEFETREREAREEARRKERELLESIRQAQELAGGEDNMEDDEKEQQLLSYEALAELEANRERTLTPPPEPTKPSVGAERHDEMHLLLGILIANRVHVFEDARAQKFVDLRKEMVSSLGADELGYLPGGAHVDAEVDKRLDDDADKEMLSALQAEAVRIFDALGPRMRDAANLDAYAGGVAAAPLGALPPPPVDELRADYKKRHGLVYLAADDDDGVERIKEMEASRKREEKRLKQLSALKGVVAWGEELRVADIDPKKAARMRCARSARTRPRRAASCSTRSAPSSARPSARWRSSASSARRRRRIRSTSRRRSPRPSNSRRRRRRRSPRPRSRTPRSSGRRAAAASSAP